MMTSNTFTQNNLPSHKTVKDSDSYYYKVKMNKTHYLVKNKNLENKIGTGKKSNSYNLDGQHYPI